MSRRLSLVVVSAVSSFGARISPPRSAGIFGRLGRTPIPWLAQMFLRI